MREREKQREAAEAAQAAAAESVTVTRERERNLQIERLQKQQMMEDVPVSPERLQVYSVMKCLYFDSKLSMSLPGFMKFIAHKS
jgi:hypothetical protein